MKTLLETINDNLGSIQISESLVDDFKQNISVSSLSAKEKAAEILKEILDSKGITLPHELEISVEQYDIDNNESIAVVIGYKVNGEASETLAEIYGRGKFRKKDRAIAVNRSDKFKKYHYLISDILSVIGARPTRYPGYWEI